MTSKTLPPRRKVLIQTTIPTTGNDWAIARFSRLTGLLAASFEVLARDRDPGDGPDNLLARLDSSDIDVLWLMAVDTGAGLHAEECQAIERFRRRGGGLLAARDHMDLGSSLCGLPGIGAAHHFHTRNQESDRRRHVNDDLGTPYIQWPNYHSGRNGDYQQLTVSGALHPVLADPDSATGALRFFPAHPHEGAVSAPPGEPARVIACGQSQASTARFNLIVAFERSAARGRALAHSSFHHFADYNWDTASGCPGFVSEAPGDGMSTNPVALRDIERYAVNATRWLAGD